MSQGFHSLQTHICHGGFDMIGKSIAAAVLWIAAFAQLGATYWGASYLNEHAVARSNPNVIFGLIVAGIVAGICIVGVAYVLSRDVLSTAFKKGMVVPAVNASEGVQNDATLPAHSASPPIERDVPPPKE
jgi:hypothetical protein